MDILAARKKAAERAKEQKQKVAQQAAPEQPVLERERGFPEQQEQAEPAPAAEESGSSPAPAEAAVIEPVAIPAGAEPAPSGNAVAGPPAGEEAVEAPDLEMLSFRLGGEEYVVGVGDVKEVLKNRELTQVPNTPDYVLGVMALRGPVLPVIDLARRLGLPSGVRDEKSRILVVRARDEDAGLVVDRVTGVAKIRPDSIRPVPETVEGAGAFLKGIARKGEKLYILLDVEKVLGA